MKKILLASLLGLLGFGLVAQENVQNDTILYRRIDTVRITNNPTVARTPEEQAAYFRLKQKVIKLYPYALMARKIWDNTNTDLGKLESNKEKRQYKKEKEKELRTRFEKEIKALYDTDGPVLVKLIHRETGKTCMELIKEVKGGLNPWFYQIAAKRYGYSLKDTYDPVKDADIEGIVQLLKSEGQLPIYTE